MSAKLYAINHRPGGTGIFGGIHEEFVCGRDDSGVLDPRYADMRAPYHIWKNVGVPDIVGFHGYRKHIDFTNSVGGGVLAPGWHEISLSSFRTYQAYLAGSPKDLENWLQVILGDFDLLTVEPFDCSYNGNMAEDYRRSRSAADWDVLATILTENVWWWNIDTPYIRPMHFVCRRSLFEDFMEHWDFIRKRLQPGIKSQDAKDPQYPLRALAYLSERIWSLWVDQAKLRIKTFPLYICWEAT